MSEPFSTEWEGLWYQADGPKNKKYYKSKIIRKADIQKFPGRVRLQVRHNPWKDERYSKRPSFQFRFTNVADDAQGQEVDFEEETEEREPELMVPLEDAVKCAIGLLRDHEFGYSIDDLVVEADYFMNKCSVRAFRADEK